MSNVESPHILVVGASGVIGSALYATLQAQGYHVTGTSRRPDDRFIQFDLESPTEIIEHYDIVFWCASISGIEQCNNDTERTYLINVTNTIKTLESLIKHGSFVVYLSSSYVFDGDNVFYNTNDERCALNEYGRQKIAVEDSLLTHSVAAIVRLSKVIYPTMGLFQQWLSTLKAGEVIHAFDDLFIAPITLDHVCEILSSFTQQTRPGILHLSSSDNISYFDAAKLMADCQNLSTSLIDKASVQVLDYSEQVPRYNCLTNPTNGNSAPFVAMSASEYLRQTFTHNDFSITG